MINLRNSKYVIFLLAALSVGAVSAQAADQYGFVNVALVFDKYQKTVDNDKLLQDAGKKKETDRDALVSEIRQLKDELVLLTDDAKTKKQENLDKKIRELQEFDQAAKEELGNTRKDAIQGIFKDIDDVVQAVGKRKGLSFIFNERALLYHDDKFDITTEVLTELNNAYAKAPKKA